MSKNVIDFPGEPRFISASTSTFDGQSWFASIELGPFATHLNAIDAARAMSRQLEKYAQLVDAIPTRAQ